MVGMKVCHKGHLQVAGFQCRDASFEDSGLGSTDDAGSKIDKVGVIANDDCGSRTGTVRVGHRRASAKEYDPSSWRAQFSHHCSWPIAVVLNNVSAETNNTSLSFTGSLQWPR
jgi:hypothetical protein